jgi:hypothetical protein
VLSPEAKRRIYEATRRQFETQIEKRLQTRRARQRRLGCLSILFLLIGLIISLTGSRKAK